MILLLAGSALFIFTHFGLSSTPLRAVLVKLLGEDAFLGIYSLISFLTFGLLIYGYIFAGQSDLLWQTGKAVYIIAKMLMLVSIILLMMGLMNRSPIGVKMPLTPGEKLSGVLKITRHPVQWAILLFGLSHLIANGDSVSVIFFGTFVLVAGLGTLLLDRKHVGKTDPAWTGFFSATSNIPFIAILTGKAGFSKEDIDLKAAALGTMLYICLYVSHEWLSGVSIY